MKKIKIINSYCEMVVIESNVPKLPLQIFFIHQFCKLTMLDCNLTGLTLNLHYVVVSSLRQVIKPGYGLAPRSHTFSSATSDSTQVVGPVSFLANKMIFTKITFLVYHLITKKKFNSNKFCFISFKWKEVLKNDF